MFRPLFYALSVTALPLLTALPAQAVGGNDAAPPKPTATTTDCIKGKVWDEKTKTCVAPKEGRLDDDTLFRAAREFAYFNQPQAALAALAAMTEGDTDRVLTYKGFASRMAGQIEAGMAYYHAALAQNPDNILARSYLGQGLVAQGELVLAAAELTQIRARGGAGTWAETALERAIRDGQTASY